MVVRHPATYTSCLLPTFGDLLAGYNLVFDPFGGTGKLHLVRPDAIVLEIEREWVAIGCAPAVQGNALRLPFRDNSLDACCTSPCYGNRMADHHDAKDPSVRNTYRHALGRELHIDNAGAMQWGDKYRSFHEQVWKECIRVLHDDALFILNISDHIRRGKLIAVTDWHINTLIGIGCQIVEKIGIKTPRQRYGSNSELRVDCEWVIALKVHKK
jgi:hypothetical protein